MKKWGKSKPPLRVVGNVTAPCKKCNPCFRHWSLSVPCMCDVWCVWGSEKMWFVMFDVRVRSARDDLPSSRLVVAFASPNVAIGGGKKKEKRSIAAASSSRNPLRYFKCLCVCAREYVLSGSPRSPYLQRRRKNSFPIVSFDETIRGFRFRFQFLKKRCCDGSWKKNGEIFTTGRPARCWDRKCH